MKVNVATKITQLTLTQSADTT